MSNQNLKKSLINMHTFKNNHQKSTITILMACTFINIVFKNYLLNYYSFFPTGNNNPDFVKIGLMAL